MTAKKSGDANMPESSFKKLFGHKLKFLRKKNRMTQEETAGGLGMNYRHYQDIEAGKSDLKVSSLIKIAGFFNLPIDQLVDLNLANSSAQTIHYAERMMREIGNFILAPLTLIDIQSGIVLVSNKAALKLSGFEPQDVEGRHRLEFTDASHADFYSKIYENEQRGIFKPVVVEFNNKSNQPVKVIYYPIPIFNAEGQPIAVLACTIPEEMEIAIERPPSE